MNAPRAATERLVFFDRFRVLLVFGVVLLHAACGYSRFVPWWFVSDGESGGADVILAVLDVFLMPLLFFIAGYFAPLSLAGKSPAAFLKEKVRRLLVPFFFLTLFYLPVLPYLSQAGTDGGVEGFFAYWLRSLGALADFRPHLLTDLDDAKRFQDALSPHLLWFLSLLFLFFVGYAGWAALRGKRPNSGGSPSRLGFWLVWSAGALLMAGAMTALAHGMPALSWFRWNAFILVQPVRAPLYFGMFLLGAASVSQGWLRDRPFPGPSWLWLTGAVFGLAGTLAVSGGVYALRRPDAFILAAYAVSRVLANVCLAVYCSNAFLRRFHMRTRLDGFLAAGSYDVYLLHMPMVVAVELLLVQAPVSPLAKLGAAFIAAVLASLWLSAKLVRPHPKVSVAVLMAFFWGFAS